MEYYTVFLIAFGYAFGGWCLSNLYRKGEYRTIIVGIGAGIGTATACTLIYVFI